jgi:membrane protease YdiL (CAAX protease family)
MSEMTPAASAATGPGMAGAAPGTASRWRDLGVVAAGFVLIWLVLDQTATRSGSLYGEAGLAVGAATVATAVAVEMAFFRRRPLAALRFLGYGRPAARAIGVALAIGLVLLALLPAAAWLTGARLSLRPDWWWLAPGLFAQHGLAEETLFRGFTFHHLRAGRGFWRAATLSLVPFAAIHVLLLAFLPPALALTSVVVAVAFAFPAAHLFEGGRNTVWAPALVHSAAHLIKLIDPAEITVPLQLAWSGAVLAVPYLSFAFLRRPAEAGDPPGASVPRPAGRFPGEERGA